MFDEMPERKQALFSGTLVVFGSVDYELLIDPLRLKGVS